MDIQAEKLHLIKWLTDINDPYVIQRLIDLKKEQETDWWDLLSDKEKASIKRGIEQADRGEVTPHEEVMAKYSKYLK